MEKSKNFFENQINSPKILDSSEKEANQEFIIYEKYKQTLSELKQQSIEWAIKIGNSDNPMFIDCHTLRLLYQALEKVKANTDSTLALMKKLPNTGINDNANLKNEWVYEDQYELLNSSKEVLLHQAVFSEQTKEILLNAIYEEPYGNPTLNEIDVLGYLGISPEQLEKIKERILDTGDMVIIEKLCEIFLISLTTDEYKYISEIAINNESLYDLEKALKNIPNPDQEILAKLQECKEKVEGNYLSNKNRFLDGVKSKDVLVHFSARKNLSSIMKNGILSIDEQRKRSRGIEMGEGPDMQELLGRQEAVSVYNVYKGAEGESDQIIYDRMKSQILDLMIEFQKNYPERVFTLLGGGTSSHEKISEDKKSEYLEKFSKQISISRGYSKFIDPYEKGNLNILNILTLNHDSGELTLSKRYGQPAFKETFFENMDEEKQKLLDEIKKIMRNTYEENAIAKEHSEQDLEREEN